MKFKQILVSAIITVAFIVPKEFFFKPESFWMDMMLNVVGFLVGGVIGALLFMKEKEIIPEKNERQEYIPAAPLPDATKKEDYNKYRPK